MAVRISAKGFYLILLGLASVLLFIGCLGQTENSTNIDYRRTMEMLNSGDPPLVIDVRTPQEFTGQYGHIPGSRLIPLHTLKDSLDVISSFELKDIVIVCRTGRRSMIAFNELRESGIDNIFNLRGGMKDWVSNGGPTERIFKR